MTSPPDPLRGANIGFDVVRRTIFAGPRPDIISGAERGSNGAFGGWQSFPGRAILSRTTVARLDSVAGKRRIDGGC